MKKAFTKFVTNLLQKLLDSGKLDTLLDKGAALLADEIIEYLEEYKAKNTPTQPTQTVQPTNTMAK